MTLAKLIQKGGLAKVATAIRAIPATQQAGMAATVARIATVAVANPTSTKAEPLSDPAAEARRQRVLAMLDEHPNIRRAVVVADTDADPVLVSIGIRGVAAFEFAIPAAKFDAFLLLDLIGRHGGTVH